MSLDIIELVSRNKENVFFHKRVIAGNMVGSYTKHVHSLSHDSQSESDSSENPDQSESLDRPGLPPGEEVDPSELIDWSHGPGTTVDTITSYKDIDGDGIPDIKETKEITTSYVDIDGDGTTDSIQQSTKITTEYL